MSRRSLLAFSSLPSRCQCGSPRKGRSIRRCCSSRRRTPGRPITATTRAGITVRSSRSTAANAKNLSLAWIYPHDVERPTGAVMGGAAGRARRRRDAADPPAAAAAPIIKAMPLMVNGMLYLSAPNHVYAVDARTGRQVLALRAGAAATRSAIAASACSATAIFVVNARQQRRVARRRRPARSGGADKLTPADVDQLVHVRAHRHPESRARRHRRRHPVGRRAASSNRSTRRPARRSGSG